MTSLINEFRATEEAIKELQARLANLQQDEKLKQELEFEGKLRGLMDKYGKSLKDIVSMLDPHHKVAAKKHTNAQPAAPRALRKVKQYKNPHTGEVIETKGGNHTGLKQWKEQYGAAEVETWAKFLE